MNILLLFLLSRLESVAVNAFVLAEHLEVGVGAVRREFIPSFQVVARVAHPLRVELPFEVRAGRDLGTLPLLNDLLLISRVK